MTTCKWRVIRKKFRVYWMRDKMMKKKTTKNVSCSIFGLLRKYCGFLFAILFGRKMTTERLIKIDRNIFVNSGVNGVWVTVKIAHNRSKDKYKIAIMSKKYLSEVRAKKKENKQWNSFLDRSTPVIPWMAMSLGSSLFPSDLRTHT